MSPVLARIPPGVQTFFDEAVTRRRWVEAMVLGVFQGWGYDEIWLPAFDYLDLFARGMGSWIPERTYKFIDRDGRLLALRPDLTSLVARTVATRLESRARPLRLCYAGEVFRYDEPRHGRQHEFHQLGIELVGSADISADFEVILVGLEALRAVGVTDTLLTLSHAGFHRALLEGRPADEASALRERWRKREAGSLPDLSGRDGLARARELSALPAALEAVSQLDRALDLAADLGLAEAIQVDLGDVADFDYYTGLTFRAYAGGFPAEVASGGRYDSLLGTLGRPEPAVGVVLHREALLSAAGVEAPPQPERLAVSSFEAALAARAEGRAIRLVDA
jgi:ATP phosphoribosyltransferase regulatory subunit